MSPFIIKDNQFDNIFWSKHQAWTTDREEVQLFSHRRRRPPIGGVYVEIDPLEFFTDRLKAIHQELERLSATSHVQIIIDGRTVI